MEKMTEKGQKTFRELYKEMDNTTPKDAFIKRMIEITMKSEAAVRGWLYGAFIPDALTKSVISKELDIPVEILFPTKDESN